jgi:acyl-CoA thioester hydrolase
MTTRIDPARQLEQALNLPRTYEAEIPEYYLDSNGHMNMMYYTLVGNMGMGHFMESIGINRESFRAKQRGFFALKQIISYLHELREGDLVAVHTGLVNYDAKRLHFMHYVVCLTHNMVASVDERVAMYIDLNQRKSTTFEPEIMAGLERVHAQHASSGWDPDISGVIQLKHPV